MYHNCTIPYSMCFMLCIIVALVYVKKRFIAMPDGSSVRKNRFIAMPEAFRKERDRTFSSYAQGLLLVRLCAPASVVRNSLVAARVCCYWGLVCTIRRASTLGLSLQSSYHARTRPYMHLRAPTRTYRHLQALTRTYTHLHALTRTYAHLYALTHPYTHLHAPTRPYTHLQARTRTYRHLQALTRTYAHLHALMRTYAHLHALTRPHAHLHAPTRPYTHLHALTRTYTHVHARTRTHTHVHARLCLRATPREANRLWVRMTRFAKNEPLLFSPLIDEFPSRFLLSYGGEHRVASARRSTTERWVLVPRSPCSRLAAGPSMRPPPRPIAGDNAHSGASRP